MKEEVFAKTENEVDFQEKMFYKIGEVSQIIHRFQHFYNIRQITIG